MRHKIITTKIRTGSNKGCYKIQVRKGASGRGKVVESVTLPAKYNSPGLTEHNLKKKYGIIK
jgi:hypothetical protein